MPGARDVYRAALRALPLATRRRVMYAKAHRRRLSLRRPRAFTEKVNWRIVNDRRELLAGTCDKLAMKEHAIAVGDPRLRVPATYWSGTDVGELARVDLPEHWVFKPNNESGFVHFGTGAPDVAELTRVAAPWLTDTREKYWGEWAYTRAARCVLVEEHIGEPVVPDDLKFLVFDGEPQLIQVDHARFDRHIRRYYLPDWTPLPHRCIYPLAPEQPPPARLGDLRDLAVRLAQGFDFLRVDLYAVGDEIWFGEITPYPGGGLDRFVPRDLDERLGSYWRLPAL